MRILQILPFLGYGDAVGNNACTLCEILQEKGYDTGIYYIAKTKGYRAPYAQQIKKMPQLAREDVIIYHFASGWEQIETVTSLPCRKIMVYHNVTPAKYFAGYDATGFRLGQYGRYQLANLTDQFDYCLAVSDYNKQELVQFGYTCPIDVLPIVIPFEDYNKEANAEILKKYNDAVHNFMFLGRIVPNKKHEDIIAAFHYYKEHCHPAARLFLVGSALPKYKEQLDRYIDALGVRDVIFPGHVTFDEILAYYKVSDLFISMSEHEGFGVPLIEAMHFDLPVLAYDAAAVASTLDGAGVLLDTKEPAGVAAQMHSLMTDSAQRHEVIAGQRRRLKSLSYESISSKFLEYLEQFLANCK